MRISSQRPHSDGWGTGWIYHSREGTGGIRPLQEFRQICKGINAVIPQQTATGGSQIRNRGHVLGILGLFPAVFEILAPIALAIEVLGHRTP